MKDILRPALRPALPLLVALRAGEVSSILPTGEISAVNTGFRQNATMGQQNKKRRQKQIPAAYYRGGTSRGIMFRKQDLPPNQEEWGKIFRGALGSPDSNGRQLNGMGGGISSLSKICVIGLSERPDADVDYTFVQIGVKNGDVDYSSNCGNMSSAVGPFAVNSGIVTAPSDGDIEIRIFNTNTNKIIKATFAVSEGEASTEGSFEIDGVAGSSSRIELAFQSPAGSRTGKLLPTGNPMDEIEGVQISCVDVGNPCIFVRSTSLDVDGTILPEAGDSHPDLIPRLEKIRRKAAVLMGLAENESSVPESVPKIIMVSPPSIYKTLSGQEIGADSSDLVVRSISGANFHRAVQMTVALATAVAVKIKGSTAESVMSKQPVFAGAIILGHSSGTIAVTAQFNETGMVTEATVFRTARRLYEGILYWT